MTSFNKLLLSLILLTNLSYSATPEQVEQYLSVSNAEEDLLALESQFSRMQSNFSKKDQNATEDKTYDMQMLSVRFRDYLQRNLSEDEMTEILDNYKNVVLLQFVSALSQSQNYDANESNAYVASLKDNSEEAERVALVEEINKELYSKEALLIMFENLMKPLMQSGIGGDKVNDDMLKDAKEMYLEQMMESSKNETLFASKDFTIEELEELLKIAKTSAVDHETKAVFGATAYALNEFFMSMTSRYDVSKHHPKPSATESDIK